MKDGSLRKINSIKEAEKFHDNILRILDLGDTLITFGDFLENNKVLAPSPYVPEWWLQDLEKATASPEHAIPCPIACHPGGQDEGHTGGFDALHRGGSGHLALPRHPVEPDAHPSRSIVSRSPSFSN